MVHVTHFRRRDFLKGLAAAAVAASFSGSGKAAAAEVTTTGRAARPPAKDTMKKRNDLLDPQSLAGIEVFQLTGHAHLPAAHVYMEAQVFTPDSKRVVLELDGQPHYYYPHHETHQYLLCDLENGGAFTPLAGGPRDTAPSISPNGQWMYYLTDEAYAGKGRLRLMRVSLDATRREELLVIDTPLSGTSVVPWRLYGLTSISSDGAKLVAGCFLGDGVRADANCGLLVFDLQKATAAVVWQDRALTNPHPQFCRSRDPEHLHDILVQHDHGRCGAPNGEHVGAGDGDKRGCDIHVIRDDGSNLRDMPWGRDGDEVNQGHQCWRGDSHIAITSNVVHRPNLPKDFWHYCQLIEGAPAAHAGHQGKLTPGGRRNDLTRDFTLPRFDHFATNLAGTRIISDYGIQQKGGDLYIAELGTPLVDPCRNWQYLLNAKSDIWNLKGLAHTHPFLSPDGKRAFFNSTESGKCEAYMITGL